MYLMSFPTLLILPEILHQGIRNQRCNTKSAKKQSFDPRDSSAAIPATAGGGDFYVVLQTGDTARVYVDLAPSEKRKGKRVTCASIEERHSKGAWLRAAQSITFHPMHMTCLRNMLRSSLNHGVKRESAKITRVKGLHANFKNGCSTSTDTLTDSDWEADDSA